MDNGEETMDGGGAESEPTVNYFAKRQPSIMKLQGMLRKAGTSPYYKQYRGKAEVVEDEAPSDQSLQQDEKSDRGAWNPFHASLENGVNGGPRRDNPFYTHYLESSSKPIDIKTGRTDEPSPTSIFPPPAEFHVSLPDSSPAIRAFENVAPKSPGPPEDIFQTTTQIHETDFLPMLAVPQNKPGSENPFCTTSVNSVDAFKPTMSDQQDLFGMRSSDDGPQLHAPRAEDFHQDVEATDLFHPLSANEKDLLQTPFQHSPITPDPFQSTSSEPHDPFKDLSTGNTSVFPPLPLKTQAGFHPSSFTLSDGIFDTVPNHSTPSSAVDLFEKTQTSPAVNRFDKPPNVSPAPSLVLNSNILRPTPFSQATSLSPAVTSGEEEQVQTFRRPPKPLPRRKHLKPPNPGVPQVSSPKTPPKPPPKPAPKPPPKVTPSPRQIVQDSEAEKATGYNVFEDILLIGQERCVEDWPEHSPQLDPDFKPSGTLRLRRESLRLKEDSDGGSGEDGDGKHGKKKGRRFGISMLSRRSSKDRFADDMKDAKSGSLPQPIRIESKDGEGSNTFPRRSKDYGQEEDYLSKGNYVFPEDVEQNGMDAKPKKPLKTKVSQLLRRASSASVVQGKAEGEKKYMNGHLSPGIKKEKFLEEKASHDTQHRWSEGNTLDESVEEDEEEEIDHGGSGKNKTKRKRRVAVKFVPQRGFAISLEKKEEDPNRGHGYVQDRTPKVQDEVAGAYGYTPDWQPQDSVFEDELHASGYTQANVMEDQYHHKGTEIISPVFTEDGYCNEMEDCKPKKLSHSDHRTSKDMLKDGSQSDFFSGGEKGDEDQSRMEDNNPHFKTKRPLPNPRRPETTPGKKGVFLEDDVPQKGADLFAPEEMYDEENQMAHYKQKNSSRRKGHKKHRAKENNTASGNMPGATCSDYMSEAAEAEWRAAQMDGQLSTDKEDDDEEDQGDTDSLMEWWNTVEQWDEVPSDDEDKIMKEDETKSFTKLADKVYRGLRVFNKVFTERAEVLWQHVIKLHAIADDISNFHKKAKIANITGGTTTAVGGVAAIAGLALAPITFGASLIVTAVGVGVATAGGITSASATISDNVNNMHDRKKVEVVLEDYEDHLQDLCKILHFVNQGLYRLRGHPLLRAGTQHYSGDWEIRRACQIISLVDRPVMRAAEITDEALVSVQRLFKGMDKYFIKDSRELRKGCKKEVVFQIKEVANVLNDGIVELNAIREELQDASGNI